MISMKRVVGSDKNIISKEFYRMVNSIHIIYHILLDAGYSLKAANSEIKKILREVDKSLL